MYTNQLKKLQLISRTLNNKTNLKILKLIETNTMTTTEIYIKLRTGQSQGSQHIGQLKKINLITSKKKGKHQYHTFNKYEMYRLHNIINQL